MDLKAARKSLEAKQATRARIADELALTKADAARAAQGAASAQARSKDAGIEAVLTNTAAARAQAQQAKDAFVAAFERQTELEDQGRTLDLALGKVESEIDALRRSISEEEEARIAAAIRERNTPVNVGNALLESAAELIVARLGPRLRGIDLDNLSVDLGEVVTERLRGIPYKSVIARVGAIRDDLRRTALEVTP